MKYFKYFFSVCLLISSGVIFSQTEDDYDPVNFISNQEHSVTEDVQKKQQKNVEFPKWTYNLNLGTSFTTGNFGSSFLDVYTAPSLSYNMSPKWQVSAGLLLINSTLLNSSMEENSFNQTRAYIMNRVSYQANEKLRISGEILYGMNQSSFYNNGFKSKKDYYVNFDAQYKINEHFSIGLKVSGTNIHNPYNPFYSGFAPVGPYRNSLFNY